MEGHHLQFLDFDSEMTDFEIELLEVEVVHTEVQKLSLEGMDQLAVLQVWILQQLLSMLRLGDPALGRLQKGTLVVSAEEVPLMPVEVASSAFEVGCLQDLTSVEVLAFLEN